VNVETKSEKKKGKKQFSRVALVEPRQDHREGRGGIVEPKPENSSGNADRLRNGRGKKKKSSRNVPEETQEEKEG